VNELAQQPRTGVLFLNTPIRPPLGADTWIHTRIMDHLDRTRFRPYVACAIGSADEPTPTYRAVRDIPDLEVVGLTLGPELSGLSAWGKVRAVLALVPAAWRAVRLARFVRREGIAIIHTSDRPRDAFATALIARLSGAAAVVHVHAGYDPSWMGRILRWSLRQADVLVAVSHYVATTLVAGGHDPARIHVVQNGIELGTWTPGVGRDEVRRELGISSSAPVIVTVCRLFPSKGAGDLIRAIAEVRHAHPDVQLLIVGEPPDWLPGYDAQLKAEAEELGVADHVKFLGRRAGVAGLLAAADVFAMPSTGEPFGLVYVEAMAMHLPVLGLANGGTVEIVTDGETGVLVTPGDAPELAAQLTKLLADPERRASMGAAGRRRVEEHFDASLMAQGVEKVYTLVRSSPDRASARPREWTVQDLQSPERTAAMREALEHDGFVVLRDVVRKDRLQELAGEIFAEFDRATAAGELFEGGGQLTGHLNCFPGRNSQFVYDDLTEHGIIDFVREVRPDIVDYVRATLNFNMPGSVPQHYHSDGLYVEEFLICNVAVVDTDLENGAIDVLPGTNREFYKFWRYAVERKYRLTTRVPLRQGDVILRKSTLWHRGMPNKTPTPRPMMAVTFGEVRDVDHDPFGLNDGKIFFFPNWYEPSKLGQLRERAFVAAPLTYSTYRFARSLYGNKGYAHW
jgi:glycosyltransferase involved in cell wall biosynthesis